MYSERNISIFSSCDVAHQAEELAEALKAYGYDVISALACSSLANVPMHSEILILVKQLNELTEPTPFVDLYLLIGTRAEMNQNQLELEQKYDLIIGEDIEQLILRILMNLRLLVSPRLSYGNVTAHRELNSFHALVQVEGKRVHLSPKENAFLMFLLKKAGELCIYEELEHEVFGDSFNRRDNIHTLNFKVNKKLKSHNANFVIKSVPKLGCILQLS